MADVESARRDRYWGYVLKTGDPAHTLDNHLFRDFVDALDWMNQPCVRGSGYSVVCATFRRHSCCGAPYGFRFGASVIERPRLPCGMPGCSNMRGAGHSFCPDCTRRWVEASTSKEFNP